MLFQPVPYDHHGRLILRPTSNLVTETALVLENPLAKPRIPVIPVSHLAHDEENRRAIGKEPQAVSLLSGRLYFLRTGFGGF